MMIIVLILITLSVDSQWMLLGENCCWSLLGLKGLKRLCHGSQVCFVKFCQLLALNRYGT